MTASIDLLRPGMLTTVQDAGRWGWQGSGVSVSGPMDPFAFRMANALVGNDRRAAALEITLSGPEISFEDARVVAVSGAVFQILVDGRPVAANHAFTVPKGATLRFGERTRGARAYLAIAGGIATPAVLGSRATHVGMRVGGWHGRPLQRGDRLPLGPVPGHLVRRTHPLSTVVRTPADRPIRVIAGPDGDQFPPAALERLLNEAYVVDSASDRIGYRLNGPVLPRQSNDDQLSDVTTMGTIQVPVAGQPILLMADRQTTGGYPRLATVITADLGIAGQAAPGDAVRFALCSKAEAHEALLEAERPLMAIETPR